MIKKSLILYFGLVLKSYKFTASLNYICKVKLIWLVVGRVVGGVVTVLISTI